MVKSPWKAVTKLRVWTSAASAMLLTSPVAIEGKATSRPNTSGLMKVARLALDRRNFMSKYTAEP